MHTAGDLAALGGVEQVDAALGLAATAGRFADSDLLAIVTHRANGAPSAALVVPDGAHSAQPGPSAWAALGRRRTPNDHQNPGRTPVRHCPGALAVTRWHQILLVPASVSVA